MNKLLSPGVIAGVLGAAASIATAYGATDIAHAFSDPAAPAEVIAVVSVISSLVAGFLPSHRTPALSNQPIVVQPAAAAAPSA